MSCMAVLRKIPLSVCVCETLVIEMGGVRNYDNLLESHRLLTPCPRLLQAPDVLH